MAVKGYIPDLRQDTVDRLRGVVSSAIASTGDFSSSQVVALEAGFSLLFIHLGYSLAPETVRVFDERWKIIANIRALIISIKASEVLLSELSVRLPLYPGQVSQEEDPASFVADRLRETVGLVQEHLSLRAVDGLLRPPGAFGPFDVVSGHRSASARDKFRTRCPELKKTVFNGIGKIVFGLRGYLVEEGISKPDVVIEATMGRIKGLFPWQIALREYRHFSDRRQIRSTASTFKKRLEPIDEESVQRELHAWRRTIVGISAPFLPTA